MSLFFPALFGWKPAKAIPPGGLSIPVSIEFRPQERVWDLYNGVLWMESIHALPAVPVPMEPKPVNVAVLRGEFFQVTDNDSVLAFLNRTGVFSRDDESRRWTIEDIFRFQRALRYLLEIHPSKWRYGAMFGGLAKRDDLSKRRVLEEILRYNTCKASFLWTSQGHQMILRADSTLAALVASVLVDHLAGAKFAFCQRATCGKQFPITSGHERKYCSLKCGHAEASRMYRERNRNS